MPRSPPPTGPYNPMPSPSMKHHGLSSNPYNRKIKAPLKLKTHLEGKMTENHGHDGRASTPNSSVVNNRVFNFQLGQNEEIQRPSSSLSSYSNSESLYSSTSAAVQRIPPDPSSQFHRSSSDHMLSLKADNKTELHHKRAESLSGLDNLAFEPLESTAPVESTTFDEGTAATGDSSNTSEGIASSETPSNSDMPLDRHLTNGSIMATSNQIVAPVTGKSVPNELPLNNKMPKKVDNSQQDTLSYVSYTKRQPSSHFPSIDVSTITDLDTPSTVIANNVFYEGSVVGFNENEKPHYQRIVSFSANSQVSHISTPSRPEEKKEFLHSTLSASLSIVYILLLIVIGVVCYLMDMFSGKYSVISESFNIYLMSVQLLWLFHIHMSTRRYINKIDHVLKKSTDDDKGNEHKDSDKESQTSREIPQDYGFIFNSHGGSLYLKIGAAAFCIGYLILTGLELGEKFQYRLHEDPSYRICTSDTELAMYLIKVLYIFYQLFFAFKFSNLIINKRILVSRFCIMHCIASGLCFWLYTIIQETLHSLEKKHKLHYDDEDHKSEIYSASTNGSTVGSLYLGCNKETTISGIVYTAAPYLYPFSIEFNILLVGFWILLWENLGKIEKHTYIPSIEVTFEDDNTKALTSNLTIYVDCHSSSRGLFAGLFITIVSIVSIILYFVYTASDEDAEQDIGLLINNISELIILLVMFITTIVCFYKIRALDIVKHSISSADDILLYICLPFVFLYSFFTLAPYAINGNVLPVVVNLLMVLQTIFQTAMIIDGLRRCSNTSDLQRRKPAREGIMFLIVMNVALWLVMSFQIISVDGNQLLYDTYGTEVWTTVSHFTLPLALFYRFHASVCLADIWKAAYEPEAHH